MFLPTERARRTAVLQWLFWQTGGLGPMLGQWFYFANRAPEKVPAAISRFQDEAFRLLGVLEKRLDTSAYLGGDDYSIADIATYPWVSAGLGVMRGAVGDAMPVLPSVERWLGEVGARPAVQRGMAVPRVEG